MTVGEFNNLVEMFEIDMLEMTPNNRFSALVQLTRDKHLITGRVQGIPELLVILEQLSDNYIHLSLCSAICNLLYIYE